MTDTTGSQLTPNGIGTQQFNDITIADKRDTVGDSHATTPASPPEPARHVTPLGTWLTAAPTTGTAGRLAQLLRSLADDPNVTVDISGTKATIPVSEMTLRTLAKRCGVASPSTPRAWIDEWATNRWVTTSGTTAVIDLAAFTGTLSNPAQTAHIGRQHTDPTGSLDVLLRHLHAAHADNLNGLASQIAEWIDSLLQNSPSATKHTARPEQPIRADLPRGSKSSELVRTNTFTSLTTSPPRGHRAAPGTRSDRSVNQALQLLDPIVEQIQRFGLAPMTNPVNVARCLQPYSDMQISHAVKVLTRQIRNQAGTNRIVSPIGILVVAAKTRNDMYFPAFRPEAQTTANATAVQPPPPADAIGPQRTAALLTQARTANRR